MRVAGPILRDRIAGSLYGLLIGDALGCPVEQWSEAQIAAKYGRLTEMEEGSKRWRPRGLHSDDGQQALALCDALLVNPHTPEHGFAKLLVDLLQAAPNRRFGLHRGTGKNFRATVTALATGCNPHEAGQPSSGNGVAMLIAPAAYVWHDDLDKLCDVVVRIGRVKQKSERGIGAAGAVAFMVRHGLLHGGFQNLREDDLLALTRAVESTTSGQLGVPRDAIFSTALARMLPSRHGPRADVLAAIAAEASASAPYPVGPGAGYAVASVVTAIYLVLSCDSYEAAVTDVVNLGDDADTTGAIVGAMAGAASGMAGLPERWYAALVARGALESRIDAVAGSGHNGVRPLVELESEWCALEDRPKRGPPTSKR